MEVFEVVHTVLAVRAYQEKTVPPQTIRHILESAWLTGSSKNAQPWHFILVEDHSMLEKFGAMLRTGRSIPQAAFAVVVAMEPIIYSVSDASRAIQSMILTAWSEGVGSNWTGFNNLAEVNPLLGIPPEMEVLAIVRFGYPAGHLGKGRKNRKSMDQVVHRGCFGQPFA